MVRLAVLCREAEGVEHLAHTSFGIHREEVKSALPDRERPSQRIARNRTNQFCQMIGKSQESAEVANPDLHVEPQLSIFTSAAFGPFSWIGLAHAKIAGHPLLEPDTKPVEVARPYFVSRWNGRGLPHSFLFLSRNIWLFAPAHET